MQEWVAANPDVVVKLAVGVLGLLGAFGLTVPMVVKYILILRDLLTTLADQTRIGKAVHGTAGGVVQGMKEQTEQKPPSRAEAMGSILDIVKDRDRKSRAKKIGKLALRTFGGIFAKKLG